MPAADPVAETTGGAVRGVRSAGVSVFQGVPYAAAPVGELRFAPPRERRPWDGALDATKPAPAAPQPPSRLVQLVGPMRFAQSEDCLTVSVWTPDLRGDLPVLVWLHGGAYTAGSGGLDWYAAERLAGRGIVVVSVTYRLGALGFLYLGEADGDLGTGNFGLLDQLAALRWVTANAAAFGGDPDRVTVAGQSAGALSILALAAGPHADALGPRLIMQSLPGGLAPAAPADAARVAGLYLAELGLGPGDAARLRDLPVADLLAAQRQVVPKVVRFMDLAPPFQLVADGALVPADLLGPGAGAIRDRALLTGTTRDETGAWYAADPAVRDLTAERAREVAFDLFGAAGRAEYEREAAARPADPPADVLGDVADEAYFRASTNRLADAAESAYVYRFDWDPGAVFGACHCMELPFVFGTGHAWREAPMLNGRDLPDDLINTVQDAWASFVRSGKPGGGWRRARGTPPRVLDGAR